MHLDLMQFAALIAPVNERDCVHSGRHVTGQKTGMSRQ